MMQWSLDTNSGQSNQYNYASSTVAGFSLTHYTGYGPRVVNFVPYAGSIDPAKSPGTDPAAYYGTFSHSNESAVPGYYQVTTDANINVELTGTKRAGISKFTYPTDKTATMMINLGDSPESGDKPIFNMVSIDPGNRKITGFAGKSTYKLHFVAQFDRPFLTYGTFSDNTVTANSISTSTAINVGSYVTFDTSSNATVGVRVGVSYVSVANAQANLDAEIPAGTSFDTVKDNANATWNTVLNRFAVEDPNAQIADLTQYYTHLYFALTQPNTVSDVNGEYWGADNAKHTVTPGRTQYSNIAHWDHGRSFWPLLALLYPRVASDVTQSLIDAANQRSEQTIPGFVFPFLPNGATSGFGGNEFALAAQTYAFGARNFNTADALSQLVAVSTVAGKGRPPEFLNDYIAKGYAPTGACCNAYEQTLVYALSDFATSRFARALGDTAQADILLQRSGNWRNTFLATATDNGYTGYSWNRRSDGSYDPFTSSTNGMGSATANTATESCSAQMSYLVPQDLGGLIQAMGGRATFISRLDHFFSQFSNIGSNFPGSNPDCQYYTPSNEPDLQAPWQYNWAGAPWRTQDVVRRIITESYQNTTSGIPGNNDWGALSAWYVQAALGLYPEIQGVGGFAITSPLFAKVTLRLENGRTLTILGANASRTNRYIQSATLNGSSYDSPWIPIESLVNSTTNTTLAFTLGSSPSTWGANPTINPPPSFSSTANENLALNSMAFASSSCTITEGPAKAVNGSVSGGNSDKWCGSLSGGTAWLQVDLGVAKPISRWVVKHAGAGGENTTWNSRNFTLQYSSTGSSWTNLDPVTGNTANVTDRTVTATSARYWRLVLTVPQQGSGTVARIYEFELYGPRTSNVALNKMATADSQCGPSEGPEKAINGSVSGGNSDKWCSTGGTKFLQIDLGASYSITRLIVKHAGTGGENTAWNTRDFTIQLSNNNGETWSTPVTVTGNTANETTHIITAATARLVRLTIQTPASDGNGAARIYEMEVYGE